MADAGLLRRTEALIGFLEPVVGRIHDRLRAVKAQNATLIQVMVVAYPFFFVAYGQILDGTLNWPRWLGFVIALGMICLTLAATFALLVYLPHGVAEYPFDKASFEKLRRRDLLAILSHKLATVRDVLDHNFALHGRISRWHRLALAGFFVGGLSVALLYAIRIG